MQRNIRKLLSSHFFSSVHCFTYKSLYSSDVTAGVLVIGDEILNGNTSDVNSNFLIKHLNRSGLKLNKVSLLPDNIKIISEEIFAFSNNYTVVLTTGGIGPTHDDVTFEAIAKAFDEQLVLNQELVSLFKQYFGPNAAKNPAVMKFASVPKSAVLNFGVDIQGRKSKFPLISIKNVYVFPGVPKLLHKGFEVFKSNFLLHNKPAFMRNIYLTLDEFTVTPLLNEAVNLFQNQVKFGSYPNFHDNYYKVKLVLESRSEEALRNAVSFFNDRLPHGSVTSLKENIFSSPFNDVSNLAKNRPYVQEAISIVQEALNRYSFSEIAFCFNGGKDCTALLHLVYSYVLNHNQEDWHQMNALYIRDGETFNEIEDFVQDCVKNYRLKLTTMSGNLKDSLRAFLFKQPHIKAVFMGTRMGDTDSENMSHFCGTDRDWPTVVRICPILNWSYGDVWSFIRSLQVPYCILYDLGYSSLGTKNRTKRNPSLITNPNGFQIYKPAYLLESEHSERDGRL